MKHIPLTEAKHIYARPDGWHYHFTRYCAMLTGGDFEKLKYVEITVEQAKKRKLSPCMCTYGETFKKFEEQNG